MNAYYKPETQFSNLEEFTDYLARSMNCPNQPDKALQALRDVFGAIRNRLAFAESLEFINLLPLSLKAVYLDGWHIGDEQVTQLQSAEEIIDDIVASASEENNWYNSNREEIRNVIKSVCQIISTHLSGTEVNLSFFPMDMQYYMTHQQMEMGPAQPDSSIWLS